MLTKSGFGTLIASIGLLALGWWWHYPEFMAVGAGLIALVLASVLAVRARQPARIERIIPNQRVARGSELYVEYRADNPTRRRSPALRVIDQLTGDQTVTDVPSLPRRDRVLLPALLPANRRGVHSVGPASIERVDPFWLAVGRRQELNEAEVIVHPKVHRIDSTFGLLHHTAEDAITRSIASDPLSGFVSMREYVDGDDPRLIHWPTTARTATLMVREHVELRRPEFTVVVDASSTVATPDDFEEIVDVCASLAIRAIRNGAHVRVATTNPDRVGNAVAFRRDTDVLDFLTPVEQTPPTHNLRLTQIVDRNQRSGLVVLVTGPSGPSSPANLVDNTSVIRIGHGATATDGVTSAAASAPEFAQGWR